MPDRSPGSRVRFVNFGPPRHARFAATKSSRGVVRVAQPSTPAARNRPAPWVASAAPKAGREIGPDQRTDQKMDGNRRRNNRHGPTPCLTDHPQKNWRTVKTRQSAKTTWSTRIGAGTRSGRYRQRFRGSTARSDRRRGLLAALFANTFMRAVCDPGSGACFGEDRSNPTAIRVSCGSADEGFRI